MKSTETQTALVTAPRYRIEAEGCDCGHAHLSLTAAARCLRDLRRVPGEPGATRARWYHASIQRTDGVRLTDAEADAIFDARAAL